MMAFAARSLARRSALCAAVCIGCGMHDQSDRAQEGPRSGILDIAAVDTVEDGTLLETARLTGSGGRPETLVGEHSSGRLVFLSIINNLPSGRIGEHRDTMVLEIFDADGRFVGEVARIEGIRRYAIDSPLALTHPFTPVVSAAIVGETLLYTNGVEPSILGWTQQGSEGPVLSWTSEPRSASDFRGVLGDVVDGETLAALPWNMDLPYVADLRVGPDVGEVLVRPYQPDRDARWRGIPRAGGVWWIADTREERHSMKVLQLPSNLWLLDVRDEYYMGVERDDLGVERVRVYRVPTS
jgi:hypothetical protein